jgi:hypothetical protein
MPDARGEVTFDRLEWRARVDRQSSRIDLISGRIQWAYGLRMDGSEQELLQIAYRSFNTRQIDDLLAMTDDVEVARCPRRQGAAW